jgi:hypothetical protein
MRQRELPLAATHSSAAAQQNTITISDAPHNVVPKEERNIMWRIKYVGSKKVSCLPQY